MDETIMKTLTDMFNSHQSQSGSSSFLSNGDSSSSTSDHDPEEGGYMKPLDLNLKPVSWHSHQFSNKPSGSTPFSIKNILGLHEEDGEKEEEKVGIMEVEEEEEEETSQVIDSPSPQPLIMDEEEPLNLTVKREENVETNNNRVNTINGDTRPLLLPNDVIIPKVKLSAIKNGSNKSKACGAINLKTTGVKRKCKDPLLGGPSPKIMIVQRNENSNESKGKDCMDSVVENGSSDESGRKRKKARTTFTGKQIYELERQFEIKKYLSSSERSEMARLLNVTEVQVKIWFQNRRTKWKKQDNISNAEAAEHKVLATKGSKKDRKSRSSLKIPATGTLGTSECSLSISGSMYSGSDDHSNGSLLTDTSEGLSSSKDDKPSTTTTTTSLLLSQLNSIPPTIINIPRLSITLKPPAPPLEAGQEEEQTSKKENPTSPPLPGAIMEDDDKSEHEQVPLSPSIPCKEERDKSSPEETDDPDNEEEEDKVVSVKHGVVPPSSSPLPIPSVDTCES